MLEDHTVLVTAHGIYINRIDLFKKFAAALEQQEEREE